MFMPKKPMQFSFQNLGNDRKDETDIDRVILVLKLKKSSVLAK